MSRDYRRMDYRDYRDERRERYRERERSWGRNDYRFHKNSMPMKRNNSNRDVDKRRSRSPRKSDKDLLDDNILSEISKLPDPSELWDNQIQEGYPSHQPPHSNYGQDGGNYRGNYQQQYGGIYDDFPPVQNVPQGPDMSSWNQMSLPPPPAMATAPVYNVEDQIKKEAAIETEMRHQKAALSKQREDNIKKAAILKKELDTLKDQRNELRGDAKRSPSPDTKRFLKENTKLQLEIQNKLKTINSVVDMLNSIIGEEAQEMHEPEEPSERSSKRKSRSPSGSKFNYVYYDPEMHWCRVCNEFPPTAKDYLNHLHSQAHHKMAAAHLEAPWHSIAGMNEGFPSHASAPTKRTPIKGLQFFVPSTAWYCKLCDQFIGDLHCASAHLKSIAHSKNYTNFVEQNPHWETDWMSDRQKAFEKSRAAGKNKAEDKPQYTAHTITFNKDGFHTKRKSPGEEPKRKKDKKKKSKRKRSSSSSSSSSSDSDEREERQERKKRKDKKEKAKYRESAALSEWMSHVNKLNDSDRKILDNIKSRIKLNELSSSARRRRDETSPPPERSPGERERRDSRSRDERDRRGERRDERDERRDERDERRDERDAPHVEAKKPDIRKMPFIGKMPVYKNLSKAAKPEEQKKDGQKKKEEEHEASKKRQEVMDAEIQKKVAEFKEKIARAQEERQQAEMAALPLMLPPLMLPPPALQTALPPTTAPLAAPGTQAPPSNLPKDFQDALDIIFPSQDVKKDLGQQDMFTGMNPTIPGFGMSGVMNPFPSHQMSLLGEPPMLMGFNMNPLFPRPQLYDNHVPIVTNKRNQGKRFENNQKVKSDEKEKSQKQKGKNKEELDDLAMLGIDASDVGAGM